MHTFSSPVKENDPLFSSPVKEDAITSLTQSVFPREVSFPTKVPSLQQSLAFPIGVSKTFVSPVEFLRRLFPQRSYSKTFVFQWITYYSPVLPCFILIICIH